MSHCLSSRRNNRDRLKWWRRIRKCGSNHKVKGFLRSLEPRQDSSQVTQVHKPGRLFPDTPYLLSWEDLSRQNKSLLSWKSQKRRWQLSDWQWDYRGNKAHSSSWIRRSEWLSFMSTNVFFFQPTVQPRLQFSVHRKLLTFSSTLDFRYMYFLLSCFTNNMQKHWKKI